jgi:hypothetical protein
MCVTCVLSHTTTLQQEHCSVSMLRPHDIPLSSSSCSVVYTSLAELQVLLLVSTGGSGYRWALVRAVCFSAKAG